MGRGMKIVMLGASGAGKTTYVSLMYAAMQREVGGFRVFTANAVQHRQLLADAGAILNGHYPERTHQRVSYDLSFSFGGAEVLPFTWHDHRGGAASGRTTESQDVALLHQDLQESDAIVVFIDGEKLASGGPRAARNVGRLTGHVLRALREREKVLTPLVIAVTKCDLIDLDDKKVFETILSPMTELMEAVAATQHIHGTVLPLCCGPSPVNVTVPVLWSLRFGVIGQAMRLAADAEDSHAAAVAASGRDTLGDRIRSWWRDEPSWASIAESRRRTAQEAWRQFQKLVGPAERLDELLGGVSSF